MANYGAISELTVVRHENRFELRFPFTASAEIVELSSGAELKGRTGDLSRKGFYLDTITSLPAGAEVIVTIRSGGVSLVVRGTVVFCEPNLGMGVRVDDITPQDQEILESWLAELRRSL